ncbi:hypothetical protein [Dyadobacter fanqingshengii]|nr:hypothetical protein [Dyadobacter fanqingshengii]
MNLFLDFMKATYFQSVTKLVSLSGDEGALLLVTRLRLRSG